MVDEVAKNVFRIDVELPGNPLRATNSYFIRGEDSDLLIDTGFRREECRKALAEGLRILGSRPERRNVLCTHLHADHSGLSKEFRGDGKVWMGALDIRYFHEMRRLEHRLKTRERFLSEGFPLELLDIVYAVNPAFSQALESLDERYLPLSDGDEIRVGDYTLKTVTVPGHTPGNCMFWAEKQKIMFTGDYILFDISPNITQWYGMEDALGSYLSGLRKAMKYPVERALPGHRAPGDYHARIRELLEHHAKRLRGTEEIVAEYPGMTAYEIAGRMKWKIRARNWEEFPVTQKWFAVGEAMSHLDYLRTRGRIRRQKDADGFLRYYR